MSGKKPHLQVVEEQLGHIVGLLNVHKHLMGVGAGKVLEGLQEFGQQLQGDDRTAVELQIPQTAFDKLDPAPRTMLEAHPSGWMQHNARRGTCLLQSCTPRFRAPGIRGWARVSSLSFSAVLQAKVVSMRDKSVRKACRVCRCTPDNSIFQLSWLLKIQRYPSTRVHYYWNFVAK
jgi:hypothetical protein